MLLRGFMSKDKLTVMLTAGLGNQMFQYSALLYYCEKYNKKPVLNTNFTYGVANKYQGNFALNVFKLDNNIKIKSLSFNNISCFVYEKFYNCFIKNKQTTFIDMDGEKQNKVNKNTSYLQSYFVNSKHPNEIREKLIKDFVPRNKLSNIAERYINKIKKQKNSISIHCRRGDYVGLDGFEQYGIRYYIKALKILKSKGISGQIYVFSDDIKWCEENLFDLGDVVFVKNTKNQMEDMWLMSKCTHNIIVNSTFSWWGAFLNQNKDKIVIMPKKWNDYGDSADKLNFEGVLVC